MKKLFFAFTVTAVLQLSSCGISAPEGTALFDDFRYQLVHYTVAASGTVMHGGVVE